MKTNVTIYQEDIKDQAVIIFKRMCGTEEGGKLYDMMMMQAEQVRLRIVGDIGAKAVCRYFNGSPDFDLGFSETIPPDIVKGYVTYALTARLSACADTPMNELYADMWQTAYTEATLEYLRDQIIENVSDNVTVSQPLGPGYFGMDVKEINKIFTMTGGESIGITVNKSGTLTPPKSCVGLFLIPSQMIHMQAQCKTCMANTAVCNFCSVYDEKKRSDF